MQKKYVFGDQVVEIFDNTILITFGKTPAGKNEAQLFTEVQCKESDLIEVIKGFFDRFPKMVTPFKKALQLQSKIITP